MPTVGQEVAWRSKKLVVVVVVVVVVGSGSGAESIGQIGPCGAYVLC